MITFSVSKNDVCIFDEIKNKCPEQVHYIDIEDSFDGQNVMQIIIEVSKVTIPFIASIIINYINNRKIIIKANGKEITAFLKERLTFEQIKEILQSIDKDDINE